MTTLKIDTTLSPRRQGASLSTRHVYARLNVSVFQSNVPIVSPTSSHTCLKKMYILIQTGVIDQISLLMKNMLV